MRLPSVLLAWCCPSSSGTFLASPTTASASRPGSAPLSRCVRLPHPDRITTADGATLHYGSIHTDVDLIMLGHGAQDARITREVSLRERGHHATPARTSDVQA